MLNFERPTETADSLSKEAYNVLCTPFKGLRSAFTVNRGSVLTIENTNMLSSTSILYSTSNFLSHLMIDSKKNVLMKNVFLQKNFSGKSTVILNKENPVFELGLSLNHKVNVNLNILAEKTTNYKVSFLTKKENLHFGTELDLKDKLASVLMLRYNFKSTVLSFLMRYDVLNLVFYRKLNKLISFAGEAVMSGNTLGARLGILLSTPFTDLRIEANSMLNIILMVEKRVLDCFMISICSEMRGLMDFDCGLGLTLEV